MMPYNISASELLESVGFNIEFEDFILKGIYIDSRFVNDDSIFFLYNPINKKYINEVINNGARIIFLSKSLENEQYIFQDMNDNVIFIYVENVFRTCGLIVSKIFYNKPEFIFGVTGTNGKTSVVDICRQMWGFLGVNGCSIGTLGVICACANNSSSTNKLTMDDTNHAMTTPDAIRLNELLWCLYNDNYKNIAIEVSSHALEQERVYGIDFNVIAFTNITQDHLDYHTTFENYVNAKLKLITQFSSDKTVVILNTDVQYYNNLMIIANKYKLNVLTYGYKSDYLKIIRIDPYENGQYIVFILNGKELSVFLPLFGIFQAYNFLCALLVFILSIKGYGINSYLALIDSVNNIIMHSVDLKNISGRMEYHNFIIHRSSIYQKVSVIIDFAHTPDGLKHLLDSVRWHFPQKKIILIFGCGGGRDKSKRPIMGNIACQYADFSIISDDNPREEPAEYIRADIIRGFTNKNYIEIDDRKEAIRYALFEEYGYSITDTIIVIAGKGHENYQIIGCKKLYFNDFECVRSFCNN